MYPQARDLEAEARQQRRNELARLILEARESQEDSQVLCGPTCQHTPTRGCAESYAVVERQLLARLAELEQEAPERAEYERRAVVLALWLKARAYLGHQPAVIAYNDETPGMQGWPVMYVNHPYGQATWHVHPLDLHLFLPWVPIVEREDARARWRTQTAAAEVDQLGTLLRSELN
jgi:hypothetical protein